MEEGKGNIRLVCFAKTRDEGGGLGQQILRFARDDDANCFDVK